MKSIPCDIVLIPDEILTNKALSASKLLSDHDPFFTLEIGKFYPHMSLYMFQLEESDITKVEEILTNIASQTRIMNGKSTRYYLGEGHGVGYIDPEYEASDVLRTLQQLVIEAVNPIRAGMRESDKAKMQDATGVKLENLQKYGYPAVGELFRPHITLTRLKEHKPEVLQLLPGIATFNGTFDRIGLFEMGDNGTCIRKIAEYNLGSSVLR
jgi:hypothetical protein